MSQGDYTYYSDIGDIVESLKEIYQKHSMDFPTAVDQAKNQIYPMSSEIMAIYNAFQQAYQNSKLSSATKWTIQNGELSEGSLLKAITLDNALTSLVSLESINPCNRTEHTAASTYTETTHTAAATYSQTSHTAGTTNSYSPNTATTTYTQTSCGRNCVQNTMRNAGYSGNDQCGCYHVYNSDCSQSANTAGTSYSRSSYIDGTTYSRTSNTAGASYTRTTYTAGTTYTEEA